MSKFFAHSTWAFLALLSLPSNAFAQEKPWVIVVDVHATDARPGNLDLNDGQAIAKLEKLYPGHPVALIRGNTNAEIREKLNGFGSPKTRIASLYMMSHGGTMNLMLPPKDQKRYSEKNAELVNKKFVPTIANEKGTFNVELNDKASFDRVFAPIAGRFVDGAKIIFTGCNLVEHGTPAEKLQVMKRVAQNFGLSEGSLYMNQTEGKLLTRSAFQQPFYDQQTTGEKLATLAIQAVPYVSLPALWVLEHQANQGYSLKVKRGDAKLYEDNFFNAEKGKSPVGERKGQVAASITDQIRKDLSTPASQDRKPAVIAHGAR